jgi:Asp/Glu/hydantoin racemase
MKTTESIKKMMESTLSAIAKMQVEVTVLSGKNNRGVMISIVIDGNEEETTLAANRIAHMAGSKFEKGGYDAELEAYFCGISE